MDIVLVGMLSASLGRHVDHCALKQLEQSLLYSLATDVACYRRVVALACYLVYLVDKHDASLGSLDIIICHLQQSREDALHVLAHVSCLGEHRGIDDGERHVEEFSYGACEQSLSRSGASHHDDVALLYLHAAIVGGLLESLVVIIYGHCQAFLRFVLSDDILVEIFLYLHRLWHGLRLEGLWFIRLCGYLGRLVDAVCLFDTHVTDISVDTGDEQAALILRPSAEITFLHSILPPCPSFL